MRTILTIAAMLVLAVSHGLARTSVHSPAAGRPLEVAVEANDGVSSATFGTTRSSDCGDVSHQLSSQPLNAWCSAFPPALTKASTKAREACLSSPPGPSLQDQGVRWQI